MRIATLFLVALAIILVGSTTASADPGDKKIIIKKRTDTDESKTTSESNAADPDRDKRKGAPPIIYKSEEGKTISKSSASHRGSRVSASRGQEGGVVVLWPRVIPSSDDAQLTQIARGLHKKLEAAARRALPTATDVDVRPEPERVCPQAGCKAVSVGVLLAHSNAQTCIAVAWVARPGTSPAKLIPWVGKVRKKMNQVPFREPIESGVAVTDFQRCSDVLEQADDGLSAIDEALKAAAK